MVELVLLDLLRQVVSRPMFIHVWDLILVLSQMCVLSKVFACLVTTQVEFMGSNWNMEISACRSVFMEVIKCIHYSA